MAQKIITIILVLMIIGGLAWYFNKTYLQPSASHSSELPQFQTSAQSEVFKGKIVYGVKGANMEIWASTVAKETKKIFTDADEKHKILKLSNLAAGVSQVLAVTSEDKNAKSGKLEVIDLQTAKMTELQTSFNASGDISFSPDGKKLAFSRFSNTEEDYGYTLYAENIDGTNLKAVTRSDEALSDFLWNEAGSKIIFTKYKGADAILSSVDISGGEPQEFKTFNNKIISTLSSSANKIIVGLRDSNNETSGEIDVLSTSGGSLEKLTGYQGGVASSVGFADPWLSYLISGSSEGSSSGQIYLQELKGKKFALQKGNQILGWLK